MNATHRQSELQSIRRLGDVAATKVFVGDGEHPFGGCGTWFDGIIVQVDDCAIGPLSPLNLDCTKRVTSVEMKCCNNPELLDIVSAFPNLKFLYIHRRTPALIDDSIPSFIEALIAFRNSHPDTKVVYWGDDG